MQPIKIPSSSAPTTAHTAMMIVLFRLLNPWPAGADVCAAAADEAGVLWNVDDVVGKVVEEVVGFEDVEDALELIEVADDELEDVVLGASALPTDCAMLMNPSRGFAELELVC